MTSPWDLVVSNAQGATNAVLVAPYIKEDCLRQVLGAIPHLDSLTCVTRWSPSDIAAGVSDVSVRSLVLSHGGAFLLHPTLHAKYYRFDRVVLVGSANITLTGLGLASSPNLEILTSPSETFDADAFEARLLGQSRVISDAEYANVWQTIQVKGRTALTLPESQVLNWRPATRDPNDLWLVYTDDTGVPLLDSVRQQAINDLTAINVPHDLDRHAFSAWVSSALLSSPFVSDVCSISSDEEPSVFIDLGETWGMAPGAARHAAETVRNWLSHYSSAT